MRIADSFFMPRIITSIVFLCGVSVGLAHDASAVTRNDVTCADQQCSDQSPKRVDDVVSLLQLPSSSGHKDRLSTGVKHHVSSPRPRKILALSQSSSEVLLEAMWLTTVDVIGILGGALGVVILISLTALYFRMMIDAGSPERQPRAKDLVKEKVDAQVSSKKGQAKDPESGTSGTFTPPAGDVTAQTGDAASDDGKSSANESDQGENGEDWKKVVFAFLCYFPAQVIVSVTWFGGFFLQQIILLPFRLCGGTPLQAALDFFCPIFACISFTFVSINHGEKCLGRLIPENAKSFDMLLEKHSAIKRKNIRRNQRAAVKEFEKHKLDVTMCPSGTWAVTSEIRDLLWHQCTRHAERAHGYADITNLRQPVSPVLMYIGEIIFLYMFPCDIQLFRSAEGKLIALNTRVHVGNMYFNPNYACLEDWSQLGIYPWSHWHMMCEAMRIRASVVNLMPSVRVAKKAMGCRHLTLAQSFSGVFSSTNEPRTDMVEEEAGKATANVGPARKQGEGGKRAQRKKAALEAAQAGEQAGEPAAAAKPKAQATPGKEKPSEQQSPAPAGEEQQGKKKKEKQPKAKDPAAEEQKAKSKPKKEPKPAKKPAGESTVPAESGQASGQSTAVSAAERANGKRAEEWLERMEAERANGEVGRTVDSVQSCGKGPEVMKRCQDSGEPKAFEEQIDDRWALSEPDAEPH